MAASPAHNLIARQCTLPESYRYCRQVAQRATSSFYWSFWVLPRAKRRAMYALYAFSRHTDDLADNDQPMDVRRQQLEWWRERVCGALLGQPASGPILPAVVDVVQHYQVPPEYLVDVIDGVQMDLTTRRYNSFKELSTYCYKVASAVGLACIHVWGFTDHYIFSPAAKCGLAFQLTNILRDLAEDAQRNRIYLPLEDLAAFNYQPHELLNQVVDERFEQLVQFEIRRAEELYEQSEATIDYLGSDGRRIFRVMFTTYRSLLAEIGRSAGDVLRGRVQLSLPRKLAIAARHCWTL